MRNRRIQPQPRLERPADARGAGTPGRNRRARRRRGRVRASRRSGAASAVHKQRSGATELLDELHVPEAATQVLVHVRDYTKGHPTIEANNHPVTHGRVVGIHNGIIVNDERSSPATASSAPHPEMTVDSEAIFALAEHADGDADGARGAARRDGDGVDGRAASGRALRRPRGRPAALDRHAPAGALLRLDTRCARGARADATARCELQQAEVERGHAARASRDGRVCAAEPLPPRPLLRRGDARSRRFALRTRASPASSALAAIAAAARAQRSQPRATRPARRSAPSSRRRSRTRNWNVDHAPRWTSNMR